MSDTRLIPLVADIDFRKSGAQRWYDGWRGTERICRFKGRCIVCYTRCYAFDDGENDPRGVLGDRHACSWLDPLEDASLERSARPDNDAPALVDPDHRIVICFSCANDYDSYKAGVRAGVMAWRRLGWRLP